MSINEFIKPELLILIPVLYLIGLALKASALKDSLIPLVLGGAGILISSLWVFATTPMSIPQDIAMALFTALTQGILAAGASVYCNQLVKQQQKGD